MPPHKPVPSKKGPDTYSQVIDDESTECIFCGISCPPYNRPATLQCVKEVPKAPSMDDPLVERNLFSLFLVFNVLDAPPKLCERLLASVGNPEEWFSCCQTCLYLSKQCMAALVEVQALQRSFHSIKSQLREKLNFYLQRPDATSSKENPVLHQLRSCVLKSDKVHSTNSRQSSKSSNLTACPNVCFPEMNAILKNGIQNKDHVKVKRTSNTTVAVTNIDASPLPGKGFVCSVKNCTAKFRSKQAKKVHMINDHNHKAPKGRKCPLCPKIFPDSSKLKRHLKSNVHTKKKNEEGYQSPVVVGQKYQVNDKKSKVTVDQSDFLSTALDMPGNVKIIPVIDLADDEENDVTASFPSTTVEPSVTTNSKSSNKKVVSDNHHQGVNTAQKDSSLPGIEELIAIDPSQVTDHQFEFDFEFPEDLVVNTVQENGGTSVTALIENSDEGIVIVNAYSQSQNSQETSVDDKIEDSGPSPLIANVFSLSTNNEMPKLSLATTSSKTQDSPDIIIDSVSQTPRTLPYKCKQCNKRFVDQNSLKVHIKGEHEKKFQHRCKICKQGFVLRAQFNMHKKRVHGTL